MRLVIQRVRSAGVAVDNQIIARIGKGFLILIGVEKNDGPSKAEWLARKTVELRIFSDEQGKFNRSLKEINGEILLVSQFTLYADCHKGRRPGFDKAAPPKLAEELYLYFAQELKKYDVKVNKGVFGANMQVSLLNDGPVTIILEK